MLYFAALHNLIFSLLKLTLLPFVFKTVYSSYKMLCFYHFPECSFSRIFFAQKEFGHVSRDEPAHLHSISILRAICSPPLHVLQRFRGQFFTRTYIKGSSPFCDLTAKDVLNVGFPR
jgi:hypothetical protein